MRLVRLSSAGLLALTTIACRGEPSPLGTLHGITRAKVVARIGTSPEYGDTLSLRDPLSLDAISTVLNRERDGWHSSWHTQPAGDVRVEFFRGDSSVGLLWIGPQFIAERRDGQRLLRQISRQTELQLRQLLHPTRPSSSAGQGNPS